MVNHDNFDKEKRELYDFKVIHLPHLHIIVADLRKSDIEQLPSLCSINPTSQKEYLQCVTCNQSINKSFGLFGNIFL